MWNRLKLFIIAVPAVAARAASEFNLRATALLGGAWVDSNPIRANTPRQSTTEVPTHTDGRLQLRRHARPWLFIKYGCSSPIPPMPTLISIGMFPFRRIND